MRQREGPRARARGGLERGLGASEGWAGGLGRDAGRDASRERGSGHCEGAARDAASNGSAGCLGPRPSRWALQLSICGSERAHGPTGASGQRGFATPPAHGGRSDPHHRGDQADRQDDGKYADEYAGEAHQQVARVAHGVVEGATATA
jgi:hypothetical protein